MTKTISQLINDLRVDSRVGENRTLRWQAINGDARGRAKVRNLSESGMLLEINSDFKPYDHCVFSFDADLGMKNYIPQTGRLVWHRKKRDFLKRNYCGVEFIEPSDFVRERLIKRVDRGLRRESIKKVMSGFLGAALMAGVIGLTGFALWLQQDIVKNVQQTNARMLEVSGLQASLARSYAVKYRNSQAELALANNELGEARLQYLESRGMLRNVSEELARTKGILSQTEEVLTRARGDLSVLESAAAAKINLEDAVTLLTEKNRQLAEEMKILNDQMMFYSGNVDDPKDGIRWLEMYRERVMKVKEKIRHFRRQAGAVRLEAQREMDRVKLILGNNGYFVRKGESVPVDTEKYERVTADNAAFILDSSSPGAGAGGVNTSRKVDIDVDFFK
jgi:hypothetical protein